MQRSTISTVARRRIHLSGSNTRRRLFNSSSRLSNESSSSTANQTSRQNPSLGVVQENAHTPSADVTDASANSEAAASPPPKRRVAPRVSSIGGIDIPGGQYRITPVSAPSKNYRPDLSSWVSDDMTGAGARLSFSQRQAHRRIAQLEGNQSALSTAPPQNRGPGPNSSRRGQNKPNTSHNPPSVEDSAKLERREKGRLQAEARRKELELAQEEGKRMREERAAREGEYKEIVRGEIEARNNTKERKAEKKEKTPAPLRYAEMPSTDYEAIFATIMPKPLSETVKAELESLQAKADGITGDNGHSESLIAERIRAMKERAGDYSRYLPSHLSATSAPAPGGKPETDGGRLGPVAYAQLTLARRRGAGLRKREEALKIVERFAKMSDAAQRAEA